MAIWYNPSLKTDKNKTVKLNLRHVRYDGMIAYTSTSALAEMPLVAESTKESGEAYMTLTAGAASDKSNQGILSNTLGLVGMSYAIPVSQNETYIAFGLQGTYYQSRLNTSGGGTFGDQYDQYGPIEGQASVDRMAGGWSYNHININAGVSAFGNSTYNQWYAGVSLMHINKPYTDELKNSAYRLKEAISIQGGYKFIASNKDDVCFSMTLNWQGKAIKHFFNTGYFKYFESIKGGVGLGMGYRYEDALIPNIEFRYEKAIIGISYDVNISSFSAAGMNRNGIELGLKMDF